MKIINRDNRAYSFILNAEKQVIINGRHNMSKNDENLIVINGYAITEVPNNLWDEVLAKYSHAAPIKSGLIYADKSDKEVLAYAREREKEKIKFAPISEDDIKKKSASQDITIANFKDGVA